jgi:hypothetical protein
MDESPDVRITAHLATVVRGTDTEFSVTELP